MTDDGQPDGPADALLAAAQHATPAWLRRVMTTAAATTPMTDSLDEAIERTVEETTRSLLARLQALLASDVDDQDTNPLSIFRSAVGPANEVLATHGVSTPVNDPFSAEHFPGDVYGLGPAAWADIDPSMHEPGIVWGAWKAMTVLRRRREEGSR